MKKYISAIFLVLVLILMFVSIGITKAQTTSGNILSTGHSSCSSSGYDFVPNVYYAGPYSGCYFDTDCNTGYACNMDLNSPTCSCGAPNGGMGACAQPMNSDYFPTLATTEKLASCLGATTTEQHIQYYVYIDKNKQLVPSYNLHFANGYETSAGLIARTYMNLGTNGADAILYRDLTGNSSTTPSVPNSPNPTPITAPTITPGVPTQNLCTKPNGVFSVNLRKGDTGPDVDTLTQYLVSEGFLTTTGNLFNTSVFNAVVAFQNFHKAEILTPLGLKSGTGFVGTSTRAYMNKDLCPQKVLSSIVSSTSPSSTPPTPSPTSPASSYPSETPISSGGKLNQGWQDQGNGWYFKNSCYARADGSFQICPTTSATEYLRHPLR